MECIKEARLSAFNRITLTPPSGVSKLKIKTSLQTMVGIVTSETPTMLRTVTHMVHLPTVHRGSYLLASNAGRRILTAGFVTHKRSISNEPDKNYTKLNDVNDKNRDTIFKYTWGTWLNNDKLEKEKRMTKFSIEGLNKVLNNLYSFSKKNTAIDSTITQIDRIPLPFEDKDNVSVLSHNAIIKNLDVLNANEQHIYVKTISSIHEGKHHRIYKLNTNIENKPLILRIPYLLDSMDIISQRMSSELATLDLLQLKLQIDVPKIFCYSLNGNNPLGIPFMIEEFIEGELLMKKWDPLMEDEENGKPPSKLLNVIDQVSDIHKKLLSLEFRTIGSIYFKDQVPVEGNDLEMIDSRWCIGPILEKCYWRSNMNQITKDEKKKFVGPWDASKLDKFISGLSELNLSNISKRLSIIEASSSSESHQKEKLLEAKKTYENMIKLSKELFNVNDSKIVNKIPNFHEIIKPRIYLPDLDPMNILIDTNDKPVLFDVENSCIKPFILHNLPNFVEYDGPKIYNIKDDIPNFDKLTETEKKQCEFIYKRTRNQYMWENALNTRNHKLITAFAPPLKLLRLPYSVMAETNNKNDDNYILIDEAILQLSQIWSELFNNDMVATKDFPIDGINDAQIKKHNEQMQKLHSSMISSPFFATGGWIPQDMFDKLLEDGIIAKAPDGNYELQQ